MKNRPKIPNRKCHVCGEEFQPKRPGHFICGRDCFKKLHSSIETRLLHEYKNKSKNRTATT